MDTRDKASRPEGSSKGFDPKSFEAYVVKDPQKLAVNLAKAAENLGKAATEWLAPRERGERVDTLDPMTDMIKTLSNLCEYLGKQAGEKGVEFITDFPSDPVIINGLEARLAQVFVNLITNAISFCEDGDAVRVWARRRDNRVLIVVEDTGPGIPEQALTKVFKRFYSERPQGQFGNHSGLGLAISRQIVEAHGGVIWAENIRPTHADMTSDPLGARFVVGLPV